MADSDLDEAYARLIGTGPERDGWLSNHAPMAVEVLAARGFGGAVHRWIDGYADRLDERPRGIAPIRPEEWRDPLGDPVRTGDWLDFFAHATATAPWRDVLVTWWPRLLPGIAAGATHGVIRVGHAVRALRARETPGRVAELGQGLAYWAARWQPLAPAGSGPYRASDPRSALDAVPLVLDQRFGIRSRLAQLAAMPSWPATAGAIPTVPGAGPDAGPASGSGTGAGPGVAAASGAGRDSGASRGSGTVAGSGSGTAAGSGAGSGADVAAGSGVASDVRPGPGVAEPSAVAEAVAAIVDAAVARHVTHGHRNPVMLVHAATAPTAVLRVLPVLPAGLHRASLAAAWAATAAVTAAYSAPTPRPAPDGTYSAAETLDRALATGDPHAIKFADAAVDAYGRTGDPRLLTASVTATADIG
ncbi:MULTISPECIES: questin oxidase family protein [Catenuloplanes]|uniref:DUF4243 domain-containing protein n=1 Tax=Catenuloplanes niger TaxID=587534 RepID=A0AAE3ZX33_9ACTN|nr:questin oxidase family protein [Catenuloplanes niger]MDR7326769.1 hypothetical protein [Catenuloplanes niger]